MKNPVKQIVKKLIEKRSVMNNLLSLDQVMDVIELLDFAIESDDNRLFNEGVELLDQVLEEYDDAYVDDDDAHRDNHKKTADASAGGSIVDNIMESGRISIVDAIVNQDQ